jgi:hypothetical protein
VEARPEKPSARDLPQPVSDAPQPAVNTQQPAAAKNYAARLGTSVTSWLFENSGTAKTFRRLSDAYETRDINKLLTLGLAFDIGIAAFELVGAGMLISAAITASPVAALAGLGAAGLRSIAPTILANAAARLPQQA